MRGHRLDLRLPSARYVYAGDKPIFLLLGQETAGNVSCIIEGGGRIVRDGGGFKHDNFITGQSLPHLARIGLDQVRECLSREPEAGEGMIIKQ
ncbi:hypothetical protein ACK6D9_02955 [Hoeflea sp. Naph1]|uniref:hypothetical protein n=1 Tax=Hoeflea sp. Naph1 TaxID=3388653 RepID=UPI00398FE0EA